VRSRPEEHDDTAAGGSLADQVDLVEGRLSDAQKALADAKNNWPKPREKARK
jgi:hypothetical protein